METKQYLIDSYSDNEGETFGFIVQLTEDKAAKIQKIADEYEEEWTKLEECSLTEDEVKLVNKYSGNGYMDRLGFYEAPSDKYLDEALTNEDEYFQPFYKGDGLKSIAN